VFAAPDGPSSERETEVTTATASTTSTILADAATIDRLAVDLMTRNPANAERISKAADIVKAGGVERTAAPFVFLVASQSSAAAMYHVDHGVCHCPDASRRSAYECKHAWACRLALQAERTEAEQGLNVDAPIDLELTPLAYALLATLGEVPDLPAQCSRCGQEAAIPSHRDHLGADCISAELFGDDAA
jgi:hypothetical protein